MTLAVRSCTLISIFACHHIQSSFTKGTVSKLYLRLRQFHYCTSRSFLQNYSYYLKTSSFTSMPFEYPSARRDDTIFDEYHGTRIADPYRWLEDPESEEAAKFVDAQNAITRPYLSGCPHKANINARLTQLWNHPKYSCPFKRGERYFFYMNTGLQNQSVLYVQNSLDGEASTFLNPNTLSEDGTVALSGSAFSEDGQIFAYGLSASGSDWISIHFKNVETGEDYPEVLEKVKFSSISWTKDNKGIFYGGTSLALFYDFKFVEEGKEYFGGLLPHDCCLFKQRYPDQSGKTDGSETQANKDHKLYYHTVGSPQSEDVLVAEFPEEPLWRIGAEVSDCGRYLIVTPVKDCRDNLLFFADLSKTPEINGKLQLTQFVFKFEADYEYITNEGSKCVFRTNKDAPNYRLITIDLENPQEENWKTLLPEHATNVLDWAVCVNNDKLVINYIKDVKSILQLHSLENAEFLKTFPLEVGTIVGFSGKKKHSEMFYQFVSFMTPGIIYHYDFTQPSTEPKVFREVKVPDLDSSLYESKQIFYSSKDGTKVPMFIVCKKGIKLDGNNPVLLYGYGGFNVNIQPTFSVTRLVFIQHMNGVLAIPNIRGGGEYGERWHNAGRLLNKQNVFDDFQAAAEYLIDNKYTKPNLLTIQGGSNGGLLVAACINQRPDLFGAAIVQVGVLDMLRFHKFTIGHAWVSDYGSSDEKKDFDNLIKYSPLHNIQNLKEPEGHQYPATLVLTADHDDRVVPLHSLKYVAQLQYKAKDAEKQHNPLLARIETKAGHGSGKPTTKIIEEHTDILCFVAQSLGIEFIK